jgi:hypothetical protein
VLNARSTGRQPGLFGYRVSAIEEGRLAAELDVRPEIGAADIRTGSASSKRHIAAFLLDV